MNYKNRIGKFILSFILLLVGVLPIRGSAVDPAQQLEQIRAFSRQHEFDYVSWTVTALGQKLSQASLNVNRYIPQYDERGLIIDYLDLRNQINQTQEKLITTLSDPEVEDKDQAAYEIRVVLNDQRARRETLAPFIEQIIQGQMNTVLAVLDMSLGGQIIPPVLYRSEPDSLALIVSPRNEIWQAANLMLIRDLSLDEIIRLEEVIETELDLSALVVGIGGVGLYPSMIIETGNLDWMIHVIGHEWTHNYLTIRPLGANYFTSPELTTINETIADLSADEIQATTFQLFYPELLPPEPEIEYPALAGEEKGDTSSPETPDPVQEEDGFDFRAEMHITRLEVDRLLTAGEIESAEAYMETRRRLFLENGYLIRKLNQAYFAFHGSYAAEPGGAADSEGDELGSQLRELKDSTPSYAAFMRMVAWKWRLDQFQSLFEELN